MSQQHHQQQKQYYDIQKKDQYNTISSQNYYQQHYGSSNTSSPQPHTFPSNYVPTAKFIDMESKLYRNQAEIDKLIKISLQHR